MTTDVISKDLKAALKRLKLSPVLHTLPERLVLARQQKMPHQDFLFLLLQDEVTRRDGMATSRRAQRARLDPCMVFEEWDSTARVSYDQELLNELVSLRFVEAGRHVGIYGPVGVGKTFVATALGHVACRHGYSVLFARHDKLLKALKHSRLDQSYESELCKLLAVDLLVIDEFALDAMDADESKDTYEILVERHRAGSIVLTSNRDPSEWLAAFADPVRAQAAVDRFTSNAYDLVIDGESYRQREKPTLDATRTEKPAPHQVPAARRRRGRR